MQAVGTLAGAVKAAGLVRGASRGEDEGRAHKWQRGATLAACRRLLSAAPRGPYIDGVKEDDVTVAASSSEGVEMSGGLGGEGEANSGRE